MEEAWFSYTEETKAYYRSIDEKRHEGTLSYLQDVAPAEFEKLVHAEAAFA